MYVERIRLVNYGPIESLDLVFPFEGDRPKPVVLVGGNGSGKSILLSQIVNGLLISKDLVYPEAREVDEGRVYKLRSQNYIKTGREFYFSRVDFERDLHVEEFMSQSPVESYLNIPAELTESAVSDSWENLKPGQQEFFSHMAERQSEEVRNLFGKNCVLYFPPNRFEEPAWLNESNLISKAQHLEFKHIKGDTNRRVISHSTLSANQDWLFDTIFDSRAFESQQRYESLQVAGEANPTLFPVFYGYQGEASRIFEAALRLISAVLGKGRDLRLLIGRRRNRTVSLVEHDDLDESPTFIVPNIFQLSAGETSLLGLFMSILRDSDLSDAEFKTTMDIRGVVIVDEIDLHLHTDHQYDVLPDLIRRFRNVQFIVTSHSPLFVLGMKEQFGNDGFALHELPTGSQIAPEDFSEFGAAYEALSATRRFSDQVRQAIEDSTRPVVFVEGETDIKYIERAADLLEKKGVLSEVELKAAGGSGNLDKIWKGARSGLSTMDVKQVLLLYDCDTHRSSKEGSFIQRHIPQQSDHPIAGGIENLFSKETLEKAIAHNDSFIDIEWQERKRRGAIIEKPERWTVNVDEKTNLCDWLSENGTMDDFRHFECVFVLFEATLGIVPSSESEGQ